MRPSHCLCCYEPTTRSPHRIQQHAIRLSATPEGAATAYGIRICIYSHEHSSLQSSEQQYWKLRSFIRSEQSVNKRLYVMSWSRQGLHGCKITIFWAYTQTFQRICIYGKKAVNLQALSVRTIYKVWRKMRLRIQQTLRIWQIFRHCANRGGRYASTQNRKWRKRSWTIFCVVRWCRHRANGPIRGSFTWWPNRRYSAKWQGAGLTEAECLKRLKQLLWWH